METVLLTVTGLFLIFFAGLRRRVEGFSGYLSTNIQRLGEERFVQYVQQVFCRSTYIPSGVILRVLPVVPAVLQGPVHRQQAEEEGH